MGQKIITPPTGALIPLADQKLHLRVDHDAEDTLIGAYVAAATLAAESITGLALLSRVIDVTFDGWPRCIELPLSPVQSVDQVRYVDPAGQEQTLGTAAYQVDLTADPVRVAPAWGCTWPAIRAQMAAVAVRVTAGFGDAADVPADIVAAVKLLAAHLYANREPVNIGNIVNEIPFTVRALLLPHKRWGF